MKSLFPAGTKIEKVFFDFKCQPKWVCHMFKVFVHCKLSIDDALLTLMVLLKTGWNVDWFHR